MSCCKAQEYGNWCLSEKTLNIAGLDYCIFHAPQEHKNISLEQFNSKIFTIIDKAKITHSSCNLSGTIFAGDIHFTTLKTLPNINFRNAIFSNYANFSETTFEHGVTFSDAIFCENVGFEQSTFKTHAQFYHTTFKGTTFFDSATFDADTHFDSATFKGSTYFPDVKFKKYTLFKRSTFDGEVIFDRSTFEEDLFFDNIKFRNAASFAAITSSKPTRITDSTFSKKVSFNLSQFKSLFLLNNIRFLDEVILYEVLFSNEANFVLVNFLKNCNIIKCTLGSQTNFFECTFNGALDFSLTKTDGAIFFAGILFSGSATFTGICILHNAIVIFDIVKFESSTTFNHAMIYGKLFFVGGAYNDKKYFFTHTKVFDSNVHFEHAGFYGTIQFRNTDLQKTIFAHSDLRNVEIIDCDMKKANAFLDKRTKTIYDEELLYQNPSTKKTEAYKTVETIYRRLKQKAIEDHDWIDVSTWHYGEKEMRRKRPKEKWYEYFNLTTFYWLSSGYAERPVRAGLVLFGLILIFSAISAYCGLDIDSTGAPAWIKNLNVGGKITGGIMQERAFAYFLNTLQTITFQKETYFQPQNWYGSVFKFISQIITPIQSALFVLAIRNKYRR